jgi:site-specific recombinase XerD
VIEIKDTLESLSPENLKALNELISSILCKKESETVFCGRFRKEYCEYIKSNFSLKYLKSVELTLNKFIDYFGETRPISAINLQEFESFIFQARKDAPKGYTVYFRTLKASFSKALSWGYISENPLSKMKLPRIQKNRPAFLSKDQIMKIIDCCKRSDIKEMFLFLFYTGCRTGEMVSLKSKNADLLNSLIVIGDENFSTKTRKQREIPICSELKKILNSVLAKSVNPEEYLFHKTNGFPYSVDYLSKSFKKCCRLAGIDERIHLHSIRHSSASYLVQNGIPLMMVKSILGHSSISTTEIYSHVTLESLQQAVKVFDVA